MDAVDDDVNAFLEKDLKIREASEANSETSSDIELEHEFVCEYVLDHMPEEEPYWVIHDFGVQLAKVEAVAHYILAPCLRDVSDEFRETLDLAFDMWRYSVSFWVENEDLEGDVILCRRWREAESS